MLFCSTKPKNELYIVFRENVYEYSFYMKIAIFTNQIRFNTSIDISKHFISVYTSSQYSGIFSLLFGVLLISKEQTRVQFEGCLS